MKIALALALVAAALTAGSPVVATPIIIGAPADFNSGNCFPFGCGAAHYQEVYDASSFTGTTALTSITFYNTSYFNPGGTNAPGTFNVSLSTTSAAVNGLSSTFANNIGADNTLLYSGLVSSPAFGGSFTLAYSSAFSYTASNGNLLLDVTTTTQNPGSAIYADTSADASKSRLYTYGPSATGTLDRTGLVTGFNVSGLAGGTVPEPASWALFIAGFGMIGNAMRRRKTAAIAA